MYRISFVCIQLVWSRGNIVCPSAVLCAAPICSSLPYSNLFCSIPVAYSRDWILCTRCEQNLFPGPCISMLAPCQVSRAHSLIPLKPVYSLCFFCVHKSIAYTAQHTQTYRSCVHASSTPWLRSAAGTKLQPLYVSVPLCIQFSFRHLQGDCFPHH